ncbi:MAG TPA: hypothetical protein VKT52_01355, partial [Ktedonobacterales bacterium]|nr:hypothetical protein [Ktedonobacterales bacterium]
DTENTENTENTEKHGEGDNNYVDSFSVTSVSSVFSVVKSAPPSGLRLAANGLIASPITGRDGNHEYLLWLTVTGIGSRNAARSAVLGEAAIDAALHDAFGASLHPDTSPKHTKTTKPGGS